jgi:hypothetical protein
VNGGYAVPGLPIPVKHRLHRASWQLLAVKVDVVPSIEQPVLVCEHVVLYDAHEELDALTHTTTQLETVVVAVQLGLD